jgi:hypothetical protein
MDRLGSMELVDRPAHDALALGSELVTRVFIFPGGKHQQSKNELSVVRELYAECTRSHEPLRRILSTSPYLVRLCRRIIVRYFMLRSGKRDDARSISR